MNAPDARRVVELDAMHEDAVHEDRIAQRKHAVHADHLILAGTEAAQSGVCALRELEARGCKRNSDRVEQMQASLSRKARGIES